MVVFRGPLEDRLVEDPLTTYLHDHLSGAAFAVDLLEFLQDQHDGEPLGQFATEMLVQVQSDRDVLQGLAERMDAEGGILKQTGAWLGEKASRWKLHYRASGEFGTFEALELLAVGILGKRGLWRALATLAPLDDRLRDVDFEQLIGRAQSQYDHVEQHRLESARRGLQSTSE